MLRGIDTVEDAQDYERWFDTHFGRRADEVEKQITPPTHTLASRGTGRSALGLQEVEAYSWGGQTASGGGSEPSGRLLTISAIIVRGSSVSR